MRLLSGNPIPFQGRLERCWWFSYRTRPENVAALLPSPFELVTIGGFAFWNIMVCEVASLRPRNIPVGFRFRHVAYRLHARFTPENPRLSPVEGLYFLRSDCNRPWMSRVGNRISDFRFHDAEIEIDDAVRPAEIAIRTADGEADAKVFVDGGHRPELNWRSPFPSMDAAVRQLDYPPLALAPRGDRDACVLRVRRDESRWRRRPVDLPFAQWSFLDRHDPGAEPEICCEVDPIEYTWDRGATVRGATVREDVTAGQPAKTGTGAVQPAAAEPQRV